MLKLLTALFFNYRQIVRGVFKYTGKPRDLCAVAGQPVGIIENGWDGLFVYNVAPGARGQKEKEVDLSFL